MSPDLFLTGQWYLYGLGLQYVLVLLVVLASLHSLYVNRKLPLWLRKDMVGWMLVLFLSFVSVIFLILTLWALLGPIRVTNRELMCHYPSLPETTRYCMGGMPGS